MGHFTEGVNGKAGVVGTYGHDQDPIVELAVIQVVPEGTVIVDNDPRGSDEYERQGRIGLSPDAAEEVGVKLIGMAARMRRREEE